MDTHQSSYHQKEQEMKSSLSSKSFLMHIAIFILAVTFVAIGMLICILNIVNIIHGPWSSIIGVLFAGVGLITAFYALFVQRTGKAEHEIQ